MSAPKITRHPKGTARGGQFAPDAHGEPGIALSSPGPTSPPPSLDPLQRYSLEQRLADLRAAAAEERLLQDALWADSVRKAAPGAAGAYIRRTGRGISHMVDHVIPFDADGRELPIDPDEAKRLAEVDVVADDLEPGRKVKLEALDRAYAEHQASTAVMVAAFDKSDPAWRRNLAVAATRAEAAAVSAHVDAIAEHVLAQDPDAVAVVVNRREDSIYGASFTLSHAVRADGTESDVPLEGLDDYQLQGMALDDHVQAYIELDDRDVEELNIPIRAEEGNA